MIYKTVPQSTAVMQEDELKLEFFADKGFRRVKCANCGRYFWTLGDEELCGESPCVEYSFIGRPLFKEKLQLHDMRESFLSFLEKRDHTRISRYPITARWRDDVFFTQASIYGFQPWVIKGVVDPPANPLAISQTCIRFNDIDNVGRTGSHLTMFEMMAHHVFNSEKNQVYWTDRTTELCFEFFVREQGVDPKEIRFAEAWWEGGGNAGPCLEVEVGGVEAATLVFMQYQVENGKRSPMAMKVVDTGYGLERLTWLSQGTPTAYDAMFGDVLQKLEREVDIRMDSQVLGEYSKVAGLMKLETALDLRQLRKNTADRLGMSVEELLRHVEPLENAYNICDHTRALAFLLNDGVVPSNVRRGYFARLLIRRALRALKRLALSMPLSEIVGWQMDYLQKDFPEFEENREDIQILVDVEEERYSDTLSRGKAIVSRIEANRGKETKAISVDELIELYDSHGLTPDMVQEFADSEVEIPDDFYIKVSQKHETGGEERPEPEEEKLSKGYPATNLAFYKDPYKQKFRAKVIGIERDMIILDKTYFYAESGGQESDTGFIGDMRMSRAEKIGNIVIHFIDGPVTAKDGKNITCMVDWDRRRRLMRHHTATHIVNGVCRRLLGNHIWQTGANKSVDSARLDITHFADLSRDQLDTIEAESNQAVLDALKVTSRFIERNQAEKRYGFRLYQGGAVPGKEIRVVNIEGLDVEACGGTHCKNTSEVGAIKILGAKRIQDGVIRLEFAAGMAAVEQMQKMGHAVRDAAQLLNSPVERVIPSIEKLLSDMKTLYKDNEKLRKELVTGVTAPQEAKSVGDVNVISHIRHVDLRDLVQMAKELISRENTVAVLVSGSHGMKMVIARSDDVDIDCSEVLRRTLDRVGGSGGGKPDFAQGGGPHASKSEEAIEIAVDEIAKIVKSTGKS
ncbi:MAG TPA: alanine--tRNA ligase [Euryarchaeota archaeon]|nr:alanine--tRNA ligase [Euryarchaeota archaeon]